MSDFLDQPTGIRSGEELNLAALEPYLRIHFPNESGALEIRQFPAGHSNLTYSLQLGSKELVLRRPPFGSKVKSAHDMSANFACSRNSIPFTPPLRKFFCIATTIPSSARPST